MIVKRGEPGVGLHSDQDPLPLEQRRHQNRAFFFCSFIFSFFFPFFFFPSLFFQIDLGDFLVQGLLVDDAPSDAVV